MDEIVNIEGLEIDTSLPKAERINQFVRDVRNPYRFKVDNIVVNVAFTENGGTLQEKLQQYLGLVMA